MGIDFARPGELTCDTEQRHHAVKSVWKRCRNALVNSNSLKHTLRLVGAGKALDPGRIPVPGSCFLTVFFTAHHLAIAYK